MSDSECKGYTYDRIDNSGMTYERSYGDVTDDTWSWESEPTTGGQPAKSRLTFKVLSPDSGTWKFDMSVGGGPWTIVSQGVQTRVK